MRRHHTLTITAYDVLWLKWLRCEEPEHTFLAGLQLRLLQIRKEPDGLPLALHPRVARISNLKDIKDSLRKQLFARQLNPRTALGLCFGPLGKNPCQQTQDGHSDAGGMHLIIPSQTSQFSCFESPFQSPQRPRKNTSFWQPQTDKSSNAKIPWMTLQCGQQGQARAEEEGRDGVHLVEKHFRPKPLGSKRMQVAPLQVGCCRAFQAAVCKWRFGQHGQTNCTSLHWQRSLSTA